MMHRTHHPDEATLMSFAAGSLPAALSAVVALHLTMCSKCRRDIRMFETIGAALFEDISTAPVAVPDQHPSIRKFAVENGCRQLETGETWEDPAVRLIGVPLAEVRWKHLGYGVWHFPLSHADNGDGDLRLLKVDPGQAIPEHGHGGSELTLVLQGAYRDHIGLFRAGDVADLDDQVQHRPVADPEAGCVCLLATEEKVHFTGTVGRILHELSGMQAADAHGHGHNGSL